jgi:hypothetical protein
MSPVFVGGADTPYFALGVAVDGNYVYVADGGSGLQILPAQCSLATPVTLSAFEATPMPGSILLTWSTGFESSHLGFNVQRSIRPEGDYVQVNAERIDPPGPYRFLDRGVQPGTTYYYRLEAVDRTGGTQLFGPLAVRLDNSESIGFVDRLWPSRPNPFRRGSERAEIRFELAQRTGTRLRVFDATGRQVRMLVDSVLEPGEHKARWDGRNGEGALVGSGIYFYRLEAGDFSDTRQLVWLR